MNSTKLAKLNYERKKLLNSDNLAYYENFLQYIRATLGKDERAKEETLLETLEHLIEAQQHGKSAEDVFGMTPKALADEIVVSLPKEKLSNRVFFIVEMVLLSLSMYVIVKGIGSFFLDESSTYYSGTVAVTLTLMSIGMISVIYIVFFFLRKDAMQYTSKLAMLGATLTIFVFIALGVFLTTKMPKFGPEVTVSSITMTLIGVGLFVVSKLIGHFHKN